MKPCYLAMIVIVFFELFVTANWASACNRCGRFGSHCSYAPKVYAAPVYHAPAVVKAPDYIQNIQFFNVAPVGDLSVRGDTLYGLSRALDFGAPDENLFLDQARRDSENARYSTETAREISSNKLKLTEIETRARSFTDAFRAFNADAAPRGGVDHIEFQLVNGVVKSVRRVEPQVVASPDGDAPIPRAFAGFNCATCHGPEGKAAEAFLMDGPLSLDDFARAKEAVEAGTMPPKSSLTESERLSLVAKLGAQVEQ
jgi:mono/diheme cytochrome c family protein